MLLSGDVWALRNNGMWVYLSPQINGVCDRVNHLSDCGSYQENAVRRRITRLGHTWALKHKVTDVFTA